MSGAILRFFSHYDVVSRGWRDDQGRGKRNLVINGEKINVNLLVAKHEINSAAHRVSGGSQEGQHSPIPWIEVVRLA